MTDTAQRVFDLFTHRADVYAEQQTSGAYYPQTQQFTPDHVAEHLAGFASYGTYVIRPEDNTVSYIVFDLDITDEVALATIAGLAEAMLLKATGGDLDSHKALLCEFSGNKGYHVWLFFDEPIPAAEARRWVSAEFMPSWREAAHENGWPGDLEVFPKQDNVPENGYGNLVKIPLGVHAVSQRSSEILGYREWASSVLEVVPVSSRLVRERVAELPTPAPSPARSRPSRGGDGPASPFACIDFIQHEGVGKGHRDNAMFHLALYLYGHGIGQEYAEDICLDANEHFDPPMDERAVRHKVRSAYTGRYEGARCGTGWLEEICPGPCNAGWRVARTQSGGLSNAQVSSAVEVEVAEVTKAAGKTRIRVVHPDAENAATFVIGRR